MPSVLITGASRGIGRATARRLAASGWDVLAGVRRPEDAESLVEEHPSRITAVAVDITDNAQLVALDAALPPRLDALVNNAGVAVMGPVEVTPASELQRQLEVNLVGHVRVTQTVLPRLRAARGRLVFVSSLSGRVATPMSGTYSASKFALEAIADSLRMELAPWRIGVTLVEPAQTDTDIWRNAERDFEQSVALLSPEGRQLYAKHIDGFRKSIPRSQRMAAPAEGVAATIEKALNARRLRARYVVSTGARAQAVLAGLTPTSIRDLALRLGTGVPRRV